MKLSTLSSIFATFATLVSAGGFPEVDPRIQNGETSPRSNVLSARDNKCNFAMCETPKDYPKDAPPACAETFKGCKFDEFPCEPPHTPKHTNLNSCYCILADDKAMDAYCRTLGFKSGTNPYKNFYTVECHEPSSDEVCKSYCNLLQLGRGKIDPKHKKGRCLCEKPYRPYDSC